MGGVTERLGGRISPKSCFSHRNQANQTRIGWRNGNRPSVLLGLIKSQFSHRGGMVVLFGLARLAGNQVIHLCQMILIVGEAFIDLSSVNLGNWRVAESTVSPFCNSPTTS